MHRYSQVWSRWRVAVHGVHPVVPAKTSVFTGTSWLRRARRTKPRALLHLWRISCFRSLSSLGPQRRVPPSLVSKSLLFCLFSEFFRFSARPPPYFLPEKWRSVFPPLCSVGVFRVALLLTAPRLFTSQCVRSKCSCFVQQYWLKWMAILIQIKKYLIQVKREKWNKSPTLC